MDKVNGCKSVTFVTNGHINKSQTNGKVVTKNHHQNASCDGMQNKINTSADGDIDRIMKTLENKKILITGGSGFVGLVLLERLLRCFPDVQEICLLLRSKKGKTALERAKDILNDPFFDLARSQRGGEAKLLSKMKIINGDVIEPELGISEEDRKYIIDEIAIMYHCAATVRFDEPLQKSTLINTRGTKLMLDLAKSCKKLEFFGHISTAYCHAHAKNILEEKPYPPPIDPLKVIAAAEKFDSFEMNALEKKILKCYANTYVLTKSLAEQLVAETFDELPAAILRPSIVTPVLNEPIPGWSSNFNGPVGLLIGAGKGVIRSMYCDPKKVGNMIPVDLVINGILITTWHFLNARKCNEKVERVYHLTNRNTLHETWENVVEYARRSIETRASLGLVVWYPGGSIKKCRYYHNLCFLFTQLLPALLIDALLYCLKIPPILCKVQRRVCQGYETFEYFTTNEWEFKNDNIFNITLKLNKTELEKYKTGDLSVDCSKYLEECTYCSRKYLLKQKDEDIPGDQKILHIMWWLDQICKKFFMAYLFYYIVSKIYSYVFEN